MMTLVPTTTNTNSFPSFATQNSPVTAGSSSNHPQTDHLSLINALFVDIQPGIILKKSTLEVCRAYAISNLYSIKPILENQKLPPNLSFLRISQNPNMPSFWRNEHQIPRNAMPIEILPGTTPEQAIEELVHLASKSKHTCFSVFNERLITAQPNANTEELTQDLNNRLEITQKKFLSSLMRGIRPLIALFQF